MGGANCPAWSKDDLRPGTRTCLAGRAGMFLLRLLFIPCAASMLVLFPITRPPLFLEESLDLGPADPAPDPAIPWTALPALLVEVTLDAEDTDEIVDVEAVDDLEDIDEAEADIGSGPELKDDALDTVDSPEATVIDLRLDTTEVGGDKEAELEAEAPEDELGDGDGDPAVKRRSSLPVNSTDQFTSKTVERYECRDWGSSVDFGRGSGTLKSFPEPDLELSELLGDNDNDGTVAADDADDDDVVNRAGEVATGGRSSDGASDDVDLALNMAVNGFVSRF